MGNDYTSMSSEDLMLHTVAGDKRSFSCLIDRHKEQIFRLIYRFVESKDDANDLAQEVFLRIWRFSKQYQRTAKFSTWLYTVTANVCKTEVKSSWRRNIRLMGSLWSSDNDDDPKSPEPAALILSPEDEALRAEQHSLIRSAIRSLPHKQRLALVLSRYEGLSYQEIATVLDCSVPAVESLLVRAKETLRKKLSPLRK
jgi:RNA polymerase sigma-70 factor, ECF subfamily